MSTLSRKPPFRVGELVHVRNTEILGHVYDINESANTVFVNWTEGPKHRMVKQAFNIQGSPRDWTLLKVEPTAK
jgi:trehalose utilization protein